MELLERTSDQAELLHQVVRACVRACSCAHARFALRAHVQRKGECRVHGRCAGWWDVLPGSQCDCGKKGLVLMSGGTTAVLGRRRGLR